jgi:hypothetical protein
MANFLNILNKCREVVRRYSRFRGYDEVMVKLRDDEV